MQNKRSPGSQNDIDLHGNMSVGEGDLHPLNTGISSLSR